jgi:hypothetical protein
MKNKLQTMLAVNCSFLCKRSNLHYVLAIIAVAALFPALDIANYPRKWDWATYLGLYTILVFQSSMVAALLYSIQSPRRIFTIIRNLWLNRPKLILTVIFAVVLFVVIGPSFALIILIDTIALSELLNITRQNGKKTHEIVSALLPSTIYLFLGLVIVFTFVNIVVRVRFYGLYDNFLNELDKSILGMTVFDMARHASEILPEKAFRFLDFIYYGMFAQIGAALIICGISCGSRRALQFVGTILFAYFIAIILFFLFPSIGPFYFHGPDAKRLFDDVSCYTTQKYLLMNAQYLWEQKPVQVIPIGYYIGFPCMHIAQPLIVLWYLRKWKNMVAVLLAYDVLLAAAILILEWHFFTDILGGIAVATAAVLFMGYGYEYTGAFQKPVSLAGYGD